MAFVWHEEHGTFSYCEHLTGIIVLFADILKRSMGFCIFGLFVTFLWGLVGHRYRTMVVEYLCLLSIIICGQEAVVAATFYIEQDICFQLLVYGLNRTILFYF